MKTKQQRIDLLKKFLKGEIPASKLKDHTLTCFHLMQPEHRKLIEDKVGEVLPSNCSAYHPGKPLRGLWDGIPIGITAKFHLSMFAHPDSSLELIDCRDQEAFNKFLSLLPQQQLTDEKPKNNRRKD